LFCFFKIYICIILFTLCIYILLEYEHNNQDNLDLNLDIEMENPVGVVDNSEMTNVSSVTSYKMK